MIAEALMGDGKNKRNGSCKVGRRQVWWGCKGLDSRDVSEQPITARPTRKPLRRHMRMELSHAYLEQYHYKALSNPLYKIEGMMDVLREEMIMNMPVSPTVEIHQIIETNQDIAQKALILAQEERIDRQQLEIDIAGMKKGYHTHDKKKRNII